jgi:hypothetical protein
MRALFVAALAAAALTTSGARAQLPDPPAAPSDADVSQARDRFVHGMELAQREDWAPALTEFFRSYALSGSPVALFNAGSALRSLRRFLEARDAFDRLLGDPEIDEEMRHAAEEMRVHVTAQVASVAVDGVPSGPASITADGAERAVTSARPIEVELDPGARALTIRLPAYTLWSWQGSLEPGARLRLDAALTPEPSGGGDALPWILGGLGAVVAGVIIGLVVADLEAQLDPRTPLVITLP